MTALGNISIHNILTSMDRTNTTPESFYPGYNTYNVTGDLYGTPPSASTVGDILMDQDTALKRFSVKYQGIHGYVSIVVCSFGIVLNIMNIVVLTQKSMISSTNYILTALAIADMLTMVSYLPTPCTSTALPYRIISTNIPRDGSSICYSIRISL